MLRDLGHYFPLFRRHNVPTETEYWKRVVSPAADVDDGNTAGTADAAAIMVAPYKLQVLAAYAVFVDGDHTGADTNYAKVAVVNRGTDGSGTDEVAAKSFTSGTDGTQYAPTALTLSTTEDDLIVERGEVLSAALTKPGNGNATDRVGVFVVYKAVH
jgi:hypothetical protein